MKITNSWNMIFQVGDPSRIQIPDFFATSQWSYNSMHPSKLPHVKVVRHM